MNIRVIAGKYGGRTLDTPDGRRMHPMGERIRNALFNSIGDEIVGARVLDAFAGTGSLGIESLSRGAQHATLIEKDRICQKCIVNNITTLNIADDAKLIKTTVSNWLDTAKHEQYDVIFADPPYHDLQLSTVSRLFSLLKPNGLMVLSSTGRGEVPIQRDIVVVDSRSYGNAHLTYFRRKQE